jgi:hypothetical protein
MSVESGDLLEKVRRLRALMAAFDSARHAIDGSFDTLDPEIEKAARALRAKTTDGASAVYDFLAKLERHPTVIALTNQALETYHERRRNQA